MSKIVKRPIKGTSSFTLVKVSTPKKTTKKKR